MDAMVEGQGRHPDSPDRIHLAGQRLVGELELETFCVDATDACADVLARFDGHPEAFVAGVMRDGGLLGLVTRTNLLGRTSRQSATRQKPVGAMVSAPTVVSPHATVSQAAVVALNRPGTASYEPLAVTAGDVYLGAIGIIDLMRALADEQQMLLRELGERARELERLQRETLYMAEHDALTGLLNRRAWFATAVDRRPTALAIFDIDHFKQVNDRYGHPAGDDVLREVAWRLQTELNGYATLGRLGGEEFAALFTGPWEHAIVLSERCIAAIGSHGVAVATVESLAVTLSGGLAQWVSGGPTREHSLARTYEAADAALYDAKRNGRNQVVVAGGEDIEQAA